MANCVTCKARCEDAGQHRVKTDCISYMPKDYPKPQTNADRIRAMTDMADEYIPRKDLEKWLRAEMASLDTEEDREFVIERLGEEIPAADVQPVRHGFDTGESRYFHCSECDYGVADVFEDGPVCVFEKGKTWSFCPNCGAKMDKEVQP